MASTSVGWMGEVRDGGLDVAIALFESQRLKISSDTSSRCVMRRSAWQMHIGDQAGGSGSGDSLCHFRPRK